MDNAATTDKGRMRRPRNLKPCHEIKTGIDGHWARVLSVDPHPWEPALVNVQVVYGLGIRYLRLHKDRPVRSRLAQNGEG